MSYINPLTPPGLMNTLQSKIRTPIPLWLYKYICIFPLSGFLGLDHYAINSQFTGMMKLIVNIFTLGSWYVYDIVQIYNTENISSKGLKFPFFESGNIGAGSIDETPMSKNNNNTQLWLYVLFTCIFAFSYFISSRYVSTSTSFISVAYLYFNKILYWGTIALLIYTVLFFIFNRNVPYIPGPPVATTNQDALQNFYNQSNIMNPRITPPSNTIVSNILNGLPGSRLYSGGGDNSFKDIRDILHQVQNGGKKENYDMFFLVTLLLIPLGGYVSYYLRKKQNSN